MDISSVLELILGKCLTHMPFDGLGVQRACAGDLMSDVLRFVDGDCLLLTGLANVHVIRTAEMSGINAIVFVCGKQPMPDVIDEAERVGIHLFTTRMPMFAACGVLYAVGITPVQQKEA